MPIVIKDFSWKQTESNLTIQVPIKKVILRKADITNSPRYIKILYEFNLFETILSYPTDIQQNRCTVTETAVIFELVKCEKQIWDKLEPDISKKERQALKQELLEEEHKRIQKECEEKSNKRHELKRLAVQEQISLDTLQRNRIEEIKVEEKNAALGNIEAWVKDSNENKKNITNRASRKTSKNKIRKEENQNVLNYNEVEEVKHKTDTIPEPRATCVLEVDFTPREFPTPSRETKLEEENDWLKRQAEARRSAGFISEDIRPEERNPQFLKAKGDEFMKNGNYLGAISAYSFGIKLTNKFSDLYVARSAAHLAIGNYHKTAQDCSSALELMKPEVPLNLNDRATCIGRRGIALCKLSLLDQGIGELKASLKLLHDPQLSDELKLFQAELERKEDESD